MSLHPQFPKLVLDTCVILDWLYFADPRAFALDARIRAGLARWIASPAMGAELRHVLERDVGGRGPQAIAATRQGWARWAEIIEVAGPPVPLALRCTDPTDQMFLDLAWRVGDAVLLSADRAVLRLARRAATQGMSIMTLEAWTRRLAAPEQGGPLV